MFLEYVYTLFLVSWPVLLHQNVFLITLKWSNLQKRMKEIPLKNLITLIFNFLQIYSLF